MLSILTEYSLDIHVTKDTLPERLDVKLPDTL